ncbi:hypothetical protein COY90_02600 [Candidatus Roizmanbacteria bacterium CG_4_10_14_0_8_um_filter_39_9]|uniref:PD(D/E)XK endonuclease domain-containing protein n=1 Tax=Candidatus Roizmanbacteria bacterium CG_4_10_14_0_8_um_filter_39_9 TaxID=1974829 RepID=A0A2M7QCY3_9BACT|nr:MAG: hypothetical protein COY90_02600 [Candidatus Roizmanbacteria bacterium CG_4_10_14_0_8_um_filter_39_9]
MHSTHIKGLIGELEFTSRLLKLGYTVYKPINSNSSCDLVIEKNTIFQRIQIKYLTPKKGMLRVELDRPKKRQNKYQYRGVDAMGIYDATHQSFYLIPLANVSNKSELWIRIEKPKNNQIKDIHLAKDYAI